jgi:sec-independent protein translocase protein TatA
MPGWIGPWEIAILLVIVLLVFGPKRLPEMGKSLGRGMREFKNSVTGKDDDEDPAELPATTTAQAEETISASTKTDA